MRLLRTIVVRLTDEDTTEEVTELSALLECWSIEVAAGGLRATDADSRSDPGLLAELFRYSPPAALRQTLNDLRRIASVVRDRLSVDTWRILNQLHEDFRLRHGRIQLDDVLGHLNRMITDLAAFSGMEMENMTRGHGWRFLDVGRRLERSCNLTSLVRGVPRPPRRHASRCQPRQHDDAPPPILQRADGAGPGPAAAGLQNTRALAFWDGPSDHARQLPATRRRHPDTRSG
jgi:uncharacterized alpha-E superfamily protein